MRAPPLLLGFPSIDDYISTISEDIRNEHQDAIINLYNKELPPVVSLRALAVLFGYSPKFVLSMHNRTARYYRTFTIPKSRNRSRKIEAPKVALKAIQKWLSYHFAKALKFDECVHGFIEGRSAASAAIQHCNAKWIYSIDIKDFFQSTPITKIQESLKDIGYTQHGSEIISVLCSYNGKLAQGSPASPVLSNLIFKEQDKKLKQIASRFNIKYTRYADDIVFSGTEVFPEEVKLLSKEVLATSGWRVSEKKEYFSQLPARLKVHGLLVHGSKPRLTKGYRSRIRTYKYLVENNRIRPDDFPKIKGHLAYAKSIDDL